MKTALNIIFIVLFSSSPGYGEPVNKKVEAGIDHVTVFYQGAQLERSSKSFTLAEGQTTLKIEGLEQQLHEESLRVGLLGAGKILSVVRKTDYLQQKEAGQEIDELENQLKKLQQEKEDLQIQNKVFELERNVLMTNSKLGGEQQGVQIAELKEAADFFKLRLYQIETGLLTNNRKVTDLDTEMAKIRQQLQELNYRKNRPTSTLEIMVEAAGTVTTRVVLDYYVPGARWVPLYDIRVNQVGKPVSFVRKASVAQSTGEDWKDVHITFSTGNPRERASKPELNPWYLRPVTEVPVALQRTTSGVAVSRAAAKKEAPAEALEMMARDDVEQAFESAAPEVQVGAKNSLIEFSLQSPASIPSDNKEYTISIGSFELEAEYEYHTVPKLDKSAFLMARIPDWSEFNLISGKANIYYEGMFVGETYINSTSVLDTMAISLGKDRGIVVEREKVEDYTSDRIIGSTRKIEYGFTTTLRNTKENPVMVVVEDQYPVSTLKDIEVTQEEDGDARVNKNTGKVTWKRLIAPDESVEIPFRYSVRFPKDMKINL